MKYLDGITILENKIKILRDNNRDLLSEMNSKLDHKDDEIKQLKQRIDELLND